MLGTRSSDFSGQEVKAGNDTVIVNSRRFDNEIRRTWNAQLVKFEPPLIELVGYFDRDVEHRDLGILERGTLSREYYWLDRWYSVFRFHDPGGNLRWFYCNINMPPIFENGVLDYIDLDIDVLLSPDGSMKVLDIEEFNESVIRFSIPDEVRFQVDRSTQELFGMIERQEFPFDRS